MSKETNFDVLLRAACEQYCQDMNEEILSRPVITAVSAGERRRYRRIRSSGGRPVRWTPLKIALVIALICLSLCFTACVCITRIRTAIKEIILDWYNEYVAIDFEPAAQADTNPALPPDKILQKAYVADLPEGYTEEVSYESEIYRRMHYSLNGSYAFSFEQGTINQGDIWSNSFIQEATEVIVNNQTALLFYDDSNPNLYTIIWMDHVYAYNIRGYFNQIDDVICMAEKVELSDS